MNPNQSQSQSTALLQQEVKVPPVKKKEQQQQKVEQHPLFDELDELNELSKVQQDTGKLMLKELDEVQKQFTECIQTVSKQRIIQQIQVSYQKFCTDAREVFEQRMSQVLKYTISPECYQQKNQILIELEKVKKARQLIHKQGDKENPVLFFRLGVLIGQIIEKKNKIRDQLFKIAPKFRIALNFNKQTIQDMIRVMVRNQRNQPKQENIKVYKRFKKDLDQYLWNVGNFSAILMKTKKNILFVGFDSYRHMYSEDAMLQYWVYKSGTEIELTRPRRVKLKRQLGYPYYLSKIYFENPIFMQKGSEVQIRVQHVKAGVEEEKVYCGKEHQPDENKVLEVKNAQRSPNGSDKTRGQIPNIHYSLLG